MQRVELACSEITQKKIHRTIHPFKINKHRLTQPHKHWPKDASTGSLRTAGFVVQCGAARMADECTLYRYIQTKKLTLTPRCMFVFLTQPHPLPTSRCSHVPHGIPIVRVELDIRSSCGQSNKQPNENHLNSYD